MANFDATLDIEWTAAVRARVTRLGVAQIGYLRLGRIAAPVHTAQVKAMRIGAAHEIGQRHRRAVSHHFDGQFAGPDRAGRAFHHRLDFIGARHAQRTRHASDLLRLDGIEIVIAAQHQGHQAAIFARHQQGLRDLRGVDFQEGADLGDGVGLLCRDFFQRFARRRTRCMWRRRRHHLDVGGVVALGAESDQVFAGVGEHVEFMGFRSADIAGVGQHRAKGQAGARKDAAVGAIHVLIGCFERSVIEMEGIGILHQEFARPHDTEARTHLVAELGLDLIEVERQLLVAMNFVADEVGDGLFVGRA